MALNPFFLQGSQNEQRLVQDLINEHLTIHGVEVTYIPRKMVNRATVIEEVTASKFDDNFSIEAYVNTYEGYGGQGDIMTKFGVSLQDELTLTISKERFEDFISAFLQIYSADEIEVATRPREGDLVYFPLGQRLFEIKFVEHEQPFYQLGKNYVYELKCELFEYEDEVIDTSIEEIDTQIEDEGFITTLTLVSAGSTAEANAVTGTGFIDKIYLNHDGSGYSSTPQVAISTDSTTTTPASAVAITTVRAGVQSIERIVLTNAGRGYSTVPIITIIGGGGVGAAATASVKVGAAETGIVAYTVTKAGDGYGRPAPNVTITDSSGTNASAEAVIVDSKLSNIRILDPGSAYSSSPVVTIANPLSIGSTGNYQFNELVTGTTSGTVARVKNWDLDTKILKLSQVGIGTTVSGFIPGEVVVGQESTASYSVKVYDDTDTYNEYDSNDEIENIADDILDFTQSNPFGTF